MFVIRQVRPRPSESVRGEADIRIVSYRKVRGCVPEIAVDCSIFIRKLHSHKDRYAGQITVTDNKVEAGDIGLQRNRSCAAAVIQDVFRLAVIVPDVNVSPVDLGTCAFGAVKSLNDDSIDTGIEEYVPD